MAVPEISTTSDASEAIAAADELAATVEATLDRLTRVERTELMSVLLRYYKARAGIPVLTAQIDAD